MKQIKITDTTLTMTQKNYSFKEKLEIARQLEKLSVDVIEVPQIENEKSDILLVKTLSSFVKNSVISVVADSEQSVNNAALALSNAVNSRICIKLPTSAVGMEYTCHKKSDKMLDFIEKIVSLAAQKTQNVEFCALDATRAEKDFLVNAILKAKESGAKYFTLCDSTGDMLPDDFAAFVCEIAQKTDAEITVSCDNKNGLAAASAVLSAKGSAVGVKTAVNGNVTELETFANMIRNCGQNYMLSTAVKTTELLRIVKQIGWISSSEQSAAKSNVASSEEIVIKLDTNDSQKDISAAVKKLGYDLSDDDKVKVYEEFLRVAKKKDIGAKELEAIVASVALQVPPTYKLISYVINNGNIISASAQIALNKNGETMRGVCIGDGPIDAAFLAIDSIIGHHYELDDFQIQSVTEGKEAMGSAIVKLRANGKLYSGTGISTDIIGASIRAYLSAVNKIVYEEA